MALQAYVDRDSDASIRIHNLALKNSSLEEHKSSGNYLKSALFGGLDGIITTFSVISSLAAIQSSTGHILTISLANIIADGLSMGICDYLSETSEYGFVESKYDREKWEYNNNLESEKQKMASIYERQGMAKKDARRIVDILSKKMNHFVNVIMIEESGLIPPDPTQVHLYKGLVTFISFTLFGVLPLLPYIITTICRLTVGNQLLNANVILSFALTILTMFGLGTLSSIYTTRNWLSFGLRLAIVGALTSALSFAMAYGLGQLGGNAPK